MSGTHLEKVVLAVIRDAEEVAVVVEEIIPGPRRVFQDPRDDLGGVLLLRRFSHLAAPAASGEPESPCGRWRRTRSLQPKQEDAE